MTSCPNAAGEKQDKDKPRHGLVVRDFAKALQAIGEIGSYGAKKYSPSNWLMVETERYEDAFMRHYLKHLEGDMIDPESGYPHLAHAAWNILAILEKCEQAKQLGSTNETLRLN